jgi:DNA polymerase III subunit gamma/tau
VPDSFSVTAEHTDRLAAQADRLSQAEILRAIDFLAAAIAAVKDGSEPRIQLEMALLKATQPQADMSLQALMFRLDQLERALGPPTATAGEGAPAAPADSAAPAGSATPATGPAAAAAAGASKRRAPKEASAAAAGTPAASAPAASPPAASAPAASSPAASAPAGAGASHAAVAVDASPEPASRPVGSVDLDQIVALWPAIGQAVAEQNGMLGAALTAASPTAVDGDRLTIAFPPDAAFVKKKAEQGRELVANAVRGMTGHSLSLAFELSDSVEPAAGPGTLDHDQLIERLRAEFDAEEVFDTPDEEKD